jgi:hypothetical protein
MSEDREQRTDGKSKRLEVLRGCFTFFLSSVLCHLSSVINLIIARGRLLNLKKQKDLAEMRTD